MTQIEQIKAEIERRIKESKERLANIERVGMIAPNEEQLQVHLKGILSFIESLESN